MGTLITFGDIEDAFFFVSSDPYDSNAAFLCRETGQILYRSEMTGVDEIGDQDLDMRTWIGIPHKNDLELGRQLVYEFVDAHLPDESERVYDMFRGRGAYGRFKDFLESNGLLKKWFEFENQREEQALRQWCEDNKIALSD